MGAALVTLLCRDGASVLAADVNEAGLEAVAAETGCVTRRTDITSEAENVAMVKAAVARFGGLDSTGDRACAVKTRLGNRGWHATGLRFAH